jgi:hypothetical protein
LRIGGLLLAPRDVDADRDDKHLAVVIRTALARAGASVARTGRERPLQLTPELDLRAPSAQEGDALLAL